jgi:hypothetical protein
MRRLATNAERWSGYRRVLEARDPSTPPQRLIELARDTWRPTRVNVARSPHAPTGAIDALARDDDPTVAWLALRHSAISAEALRFVADKEAVKSGAGLDGVALRYVVHHPNTPDDLRRQLAAAGACRCSQPYGGCPGTHTYWAHVPSTHRNEGLSALLRRTFRRRRRAPSRTKPS